jgi:pimeloyl-ACP methyl ester carboxylesterase
LKQEIDAAVDKAKRIELPTPSGMQVWHVWNEAAANPLVLLHGGSGSWNHWVRNVLPLSESRAVWALDTPGLGDSELPSGAEDADDLSVPLAQGLKALFKEEPVDMVGFSFGALVAGLWAQALPQRAARLVLVGSPALSAERLPPLDLRRWDQQPPGDARLAVHRHNLLQLMLAHAASATQLAVGLHAANVERDRLRQRRLMLTDALVHLLPTLACPVHGIWGALDVLYASRLPLIGQVLATAPGYRGLVLLPGAGHWVAFEAAEAFNAALLAALAGG